MQNIKYDVIVIGGGPSGLTASIYTSRAELSTLVFAGNPPGGQLMWTTDVENFPGFDEGIMGPELIAKMRTQSQKFGVEILDLNVVKVEGTFESGFSVTAEDGKVHNARSVIVATGADAKWLNLPSEQALRGKGVSACATCDGFFFKDKVIAVVGGGDASMEEANYLTKYATKVYLLVRKGAEDVRASKIMLRRAQNNPKIEFLYNTEVLEVLGENFVTGLSVLNNKTNEKSELEIQGLFVAIGHKPNTDFLSGYIEVDHVGYARHVENTVSSVKGIFVAGDVHDHRYRQAITAAGYGCMAAIDCERFLAEN